MSSCMTEVKVETRGIRCNFCNKATVDPLMLGPMYKYQSIVLHYFCMLFSAGLSQNGEDEEGILGFLPKDIKKELNRGKKLKCKYCKEVGATVGCTVKACKMSFHYSCGLDNGCMYQFIDKYESFCVRHHKKPDITIPMESWECPICFCDFKDEKFPIRSPCCKNNTAIFHRRCIMECANKSGLHFFKCPLCNDKELFSKEMRLQGVYVPDRDAEWETEPNAYAELNQHYKRCDKQPCLCRAGREFNSDEGENKDWKIITCGGCGAAAVHMKCEGLTNFTYRCPTCITVLNGYDFDDSDDDLSQGRRADVSRSRENRINRQPFIDSDSEEDEHVHNIDNILESIKLNTPEALIEEDNDTDSILESAKSSSSHEEENTTEILLKSSFSRANQFVADTKNNENYDSCSSHEDDDFEEREDDFISPSPNISGEVDIGERSQSLTNDIRVRTGLVEVVSQNREDVFKIVSNGRKISRPSDRKIRKQCPLPYIVPTKSFPSNDVEENVKKLETKFGVVLRKAFTIVSSDEDKSEENIEAHCSRFLPTTNRNINTPRRSCETSPSERQHQNKIVIDAANGYNTHLCKLPTFSSRMNLNYTDPGQNSSSTSRSNSSENSHSKNSIIKQHHLSLFSTAFLKKHLKSEPENVFTPDFELEPSEQSVNSHDADSKPEIEVENLQKSSDYDSSYPQIINLQTTNCESVEPTYNSDPDNSELEPSEQSVNSHDADSKPEIEVENLQKSSDCDSSYPQMINLQTTNCESVEPTYNSDPDNSEIEQLLDASHNNDFPLSSPPSISPTFSSNHKSITPTATSSASSSTNSISSRHRTPPISKVPPLIKQSKSPKPKTAKKSSTLPKSDHPSSHKNTVQTKLDTWLSPTSETIPTSSITTSRIVRNLSPEFGRYKAPIFTPSPSIQHDLKTSLSKSDDDDDCRVVGESSNPSRRPCITIIDDDEDDDDIKIEAVKLVSDTANTSPIKGNNDIDWTDMSTLFKQPPLRKQSVKAAHRKYFNGTVGLSAALISNAIGLGSRRKIETNTNAGSDPEVVTLDDDDDEEPQPKVDSSQSDGTRASEIDDKSECAESDTIPNRDRDLPGSKRGRDGEGISVLPEPTDSDDNITSKRPRVDTIDIQKQES